MAGGVDYTALASALERAWTDHVKEMVEDLVYDAIKENIDDKTIQEMIHESVDRYIAVAMMSTINERVRRIVNQEYKIKVEPIERGER